MAPDFRPVVFGDIADDPGREVREGRGYGAVLRRLVPHEPASSLAVRAASLGVLFSRGLPQFVCGERQQIVRRVPCGKVVVYALLLAAFSGGQVD